MTDSPRPILLGGYAAKFCPVRTHNDFAPAIPKVEWVPSAQVAADLEAGRQFEAEVFAELLRRHPDTAILVDSALPKAEAIAATVAALESSVPLVLGGWLPDDLTGRRTGRPDILLHVDGGYLPADVKHHKTIQPAKKATKRVSSLARPAHWWDAPGVTASAHHYEDSLQLAHYTRMLKACGFHPGDDRLLGAILGTSLLAASGHEPEHILVWHDLTTPSRPTFSRSRGRVLRSVLECYDHEFDFRVRVAETASRITGSAADPEPLVVPIGQRECVDCPYLPWCSDIMGSDDASVDITRDRLDIREWLALRHMGIATTAALAELQPDDPEFFELYYPEVTVHSRDQALQRLQRAVRQARMICEGLDFEPIAVAAVHVPVADIEIDFDIEWDKSGRIYQWGLRIRDGHDDATARYTPIISFEPLDDELELDLAARAAAVIAGLREQARQAGRSIAVYHWHHVEVSKTRKFASVRAALDGVTLDLWAWFTATFHVRGDASIKAVAQFFGFAWAVDDPGGRVSQDKIEIARAGGADAADARQWCLRYNESDVAAQAAIRDGVRAMLASGELAG